MNDLRVHKSVSGACGLTGFAIAILAGLAADNPANVILTRALIAMAACYAVGVFIGMLASRAVREAAASHIADNPAPEIDDVRRTAQSNSAPANGAKQATPRAEAA